MKNVKILRALIGVFVIANSGVILFNLFALLQILPSSNNSAALLSSTICLIGFIKQILLLPSLVLLFQAVHHFVKHGYFNMLSARKLKLSGIILVINSVAEYFAIRILYIYTVKAIDGERKFSAQWIEGLPMLFVVLLAGFGLYTLSDFIRKGEAIERENELTI